MNGQPEPQAGGITIFTIGFAQKNAQTFFETLQRASVQRVVDIRLNNESQLAGFTKKRDLAYFLKSIAGIEYTHRAELAPTKELLDGYKKKRVTWADYERLFLDLLNQRKPEALLARADMDKACLLCSEPKADKCHRRLVAEYLRGKWANVQVMHL
jgi:uncharacterized protein (DUF488 family)